MEHLGVMCSKSFRILPFFPVSLITLGNRFAPLRPRCFSRRKVEFIPQGHWGEGIN